MKAADALTTLCRLAIGTIFVEHSIKNYVGEYNNYDQKNVRKTSFFEVGLLILFDIRCTLPCRSNFLECFYQAAFERVRLREEHRDRIRQCCVDVYHLTFKTKRD